MTDSTNQRDLVARLDAESAIHRLHAIYIHRLDNGDFEGVADVLKHAVIHVLGNEASTVEGLLAFFNAGLQVHGDGTPRTWHSITNQLIDVDPSGERASSASYYTVHQQVDDFPLQPICTGKYLDQFERSDGEWRFTRREVTLRFAGVLQHHVKGAQRDAVAQTA
ncbi:nuclear transport factor 2 family protein [Stutzerimonas stutzeri]|uniref:Nuclear transport factor 2 family protein n=1 Tax=Stutzerimonas stutzeri TaxID=316 RepID=A0A6I6LXI1_STUST|nr:nuclear transport factor 2 family protein [Stutzerimonas stutzeri]QGZ31071.1 nuclear transport factor 2 family protein [Stutzerimonas stutzeri]